MEREELTNREYKLAINSDGFYIIDAAALASIGISKEALDEVKLNLNKEVENVIFVPIVYHENENAIVFSVIAEHDDKILTSLTIEPSEIESSVQYEVERVDKIDALPGDEIVEIEDEESTISELGVDLNKRIRQTPRAREERKKKTSDVSMAPTNAGRHRRSKGGSKVDSIKKLPTPSGLKKAGEKGGKAGGEGMKRKAEWQKKLKEEIDKLYHQVFVLGDGDKFNKLKNLMEQYRG